MPIESPIPSQTIADRPNVPAVGAMPGELGKLTSASAVSILRDGVAGVPDVPQLNSLREGAGRREMHLVGVGRIVEGFVGGDMVVAPSLPKPAVVNHVTIEGLAPAWVPRTYNPQVASSVAQKVLRRRKGGRVVPDYVFNPDGRTTFKPSGYPWHCIGRLFVWKDAAAASWSYWGSAALVGKNAILTASHCVPWGSRSGNWKAKFVPAYYDGSSTLGSSVFSWVASAYGYAEHAQGDDMAVMKLHDSLGASLGYFGTKTYSDDWEDDPYWTLVGYPGSIAGGQRPTVQSSISIIDDDSDGAGVELEHRADTSGGNSGGPMFAWWQNGPYVIGTHSGSEEEYHPPASIVKNNVAAGGTALVELVKYAHSHW